MDKMLAKFLITCLLCEFIGLTAGLPLTDDKDPSEKQIPSINSDKIIQVGLPYLSVSIPNPLPTVERIVATVGNLLSSENAGPKLSENANENNKESSPADIFVQSNAVKQNIQADNNKEIANEKTKDNADPPTPKNNDEKKQIPNKRAVTDIDAGILKPDNSLIDPVPVDLKEKVPAEIDSSQPAAAKVGV